MKNHYARLSYYFFLCLLFSLFCCTSKTQLSQEEENYLSENPDVTIGIYVNYPPYQFVNNNGRIEGILIDYFSKLESNIGHTFKRKYYNDWQTLILEAQQKKIDIILEIQKTEDRKQFLTFTDPIFIGKHIILTKNDSPLKSINDLNGKRVAIGENFSVEEYIKNNYPEIIIVPKTNEESCIHALIDGEVDAFIGIEAITNYIIRKEDYTNLKIKESLEYDYKLSVGIIKNRKILADIIKKGNSSISTKEKNEILNKWLYDVAIAYNDKIPFFKQLFAVLVTLLIFSCVLNLYYINRLNTIKKKYPIIKD